MLQRLTDRVNHLNLQADCLHREKEEINRKLDKISAEWEDCENRIESLLPEGVTLLDHFRAEEERRKGVGPGQLPPQSPPKSQTPDEPSSGNPSEQGPETIS